MLHDTARFSVRDNFFVCGGNPTADDTPSDGGGVIGSAPTLKQAGNLRAEAMKAGYQNTRIYTAKEMFNGE